MKKVISLVVVLLAISYVAPSFAAQAQVAGDVAEGRIGQIMQEYAVPREFAHEIYQQELASQAPVVDDAAGLSVEARAAIADYQENLGISFSDAKAIYDDERATARAQAERDAEEAAYQAQLAAVTAASAAQSYDFSGTFGRATTDAERAAQEEIEMRQALQRSLAESEIAEGKARAAEACSAKAAPAPSAGARDAAALVGSVVSQRAAALAAGRFGAGEVSVAAKPAVVRPSLQPVARSGYVGQAPKISGALSTADAERLARRRAEQLRKEADAEAASAAAVGSASSAASAGTGSNSLADWDPFA